MAYYLLVTSTLDTTDVEWNRTGAVVTLSCRHALCSHTNTEFWKIICFISSTYGSLEVL